MYFWAHEPRDGKWFQILNLLVWTVFYLKVSTNWITNVLDVTDTAKITVKGNKIEGYVQSFQVS